MNQDGQLLRMWTVCRSGELRSWLPNKKFASHEWWSADGKAIYYIDSATPRAGTMRIDLETEEHSIVDPDGSWHAHASCDGRYFVHDRAASDQGFFRGMPATVGFHNRETGRGITIAHLPASATAERQSEYHPDPHPNFVCGDRYVVYTTTVLGRLDVALTPVDQLVERTQ